MPETPEVLLLLVLFANSAKCFEGTRNLLTEVLQKNVKYFQLFWTDGYKLHLSTAQEGKWEEYQNMKNVEGNEVFFLHQLPLDRKSVV